MYLGILLWDTAMAKFVAFGLGDIQWVANWSTAGDSKVVNGTWAMTVPRFDVDP